MDSFLQSILNYDKLLHFIVFLLLAIMLTWIMQHLPRSNRTITRFMTIGFTLSFIAIIEEYRQFLLVNRSTEFLDAIAGIIGVWTGITLMMLILLFKNKVTFTGSMMRGIPSVLGTTIFLIFILFGVLLFDETPKSTVQDEAATVPVFNQVKSTTTEKAISMKDELYQAAFGTKTIETFLPQEREISAQEIIHVYENYFKDLKLYASIMSDQLLNDAVVEYKTRDENPDFTLFSYLKKYKSEGIGLQAEIDKVFDAFYKKLQADLERNGHNPELAEPFLDQYKKEKRERVKTILAFLRKELL